MKQSLSLSDDVGSRLKAVARAIPDANPSILADLAIKQLLDRPSKEIAEMLTRYRIERNPRARDWWRKSFWILLAENMATFDPIENPYVARDYEDYYLVLLRSSVARDDEENDPFYVHMGPRAGTDGAAEGWSFPRPTSPAEAALKVATRLKELGVAMDYEGRIRKVRSILTERLGANPSNPERFGNGSFVFAMDYGAEGQRGSMVWQVMRVDQPKSRGTRLTFQWRSNSARQMAESLITAYANLESAE